MFTYNNWQQQLNLFYIAVSFLTRIPVPESVDFSQQKLNQASRYFPLVGWLIGIICALVFALTELFLPSNIAVIFSMLVGILITGCFHEDGLADTCDGLGGGWEKAQKLSIMKDSRIGTYGATALWFGLTLKFLLLSSLADLTAVTVALIVAHPLSRSMATLIIFLLPYVSETETAKAKPLAESQKKIDLYISLAIGGIGLVLIINSALWIVLSLVISVIAIRTYLFRQIGGFTGDTLGATQQISELLIYLTILAVEIN